MTRTALVTGVSGRKGIGAAIARRLLSDKHRVFARSWSPYDETEPWGADPIDEVLADLVRRAVSAFGPLDTLVARWRPSPN
ncbi:hypothetical protein GCM10009754_06420 [Amycolatopsis minnesotensis]|uniref:Short chain dehydrogenase n=1 Tax=Amycolatopsis minnesotensis TaxID=337894 RepID=A0ABP5BDP9_9PSEU